jgi:hypothetical protein
MHDNLPLGPNGLPLANLGDPSFDGERVYIVTLKEYEDNEDFYRDMEDNGGPLHIPKRVITCVDYKVNERNSDWLLTHDEAAALTHDPRVGAVELNPDDLGLIITRHDWESTGTFKKSIAFQPTDVNWGIYRTRSKNNTAGWGASGSYSLPNNTKVISDSSGKNVDVVIWDGGFPNPATLEFAQNSDGTGYPRGVEYDWYPTIKYTTLVNAHQAHTSGTVAGNRQGFARDSNIYNGSLYDSYIYVKQFHLNKPINPLTGLRNPTVANNSWGYSSSSIRSYNTLKVNTSRVHFRGVNYYPTSGSAGSYVWDNTQFQSYGIPPQFGNGFPSRSAASDANFIDAAKAGVINVVSAGNSYFYVATPSDDPNADYNNYFVFNSSTYYYHRGSSPGAADEVINGKYTKDYSPILVGAMGAVNTGTVSSNTTNYLYGRSGGYTGLLSQDYKSEFSNYGPGVDVYAPGEVVLSVINSTGYSSGATTDPRVKTVYGIDYDGDDMLGLDAGTSMSGPHVAGVLACMLEKFPRMTHPEAREWIKTTSQSTLASTRGGPGDGTDAGISWSSSSTTKVLFFPGTRVREAEVGGFFTSPYPIVNNKYRTSTGSVWPRVSSLNSQNNISMSLSVSTSTLSTYGSSATITLTTTNVPDGTKIPYVLTGKLYQPLVNTPYKFTKNSLALIGGVPITKDYAYTVLAGSNFPLVEIGAEGKTFSAFPGLPGQRITTAASVPYGGTSINTTISYAVLGARSLTASTVPTFGSNDDGYWTVYLPFNITYLGVSYSVIYVGTNSYITFGSGSLNYQYLSSSIPPYPKIMISAEDNSCQRIYYGEEGSGLARTYRVRFEGHNAATGGVLGSADMCWEITFYEATPDTFDVQISTNSRVVTEAGVPMVGDFTVYNNSATITVSTSSYDKYTVYMRTNTFPTTSTSFVINA